MDTDDYLYRKSVRDKFVLGLMEMDLAEVYDPEKIVRSE